MAHKLNDRYIEKYTGLTPQQISGMPIKDVHAAIGERIGHKLTKIEREPGSVTRNMLMALGEVVTQEEIDVELAKI